MVKLNYEKSFANFFFLQKDPAIEKFGWIRENTDMYFKFKPRTVRNVLIWALLIPGAFLYFIKKTPVGLLPIIISLRMPIYVVNNTVFKFLVLNCLD